MLKKIKRVLHICIVLAIIITTLPLSMMENTKAATQDKFVDVISFHDSVGYYAQGGKVFQYNQIEQSTQQVRIADVSVVSLAYDGNILYLVSEDMTVLAYDVKTSALIWKNETLKGNGNDLASPLFLDQGILYIGISTSNASIIYQIQSSDGTIVKSSKGSSRVVNGSLPYKSSDKVVFSSKDLAFVNENSEQYVKLYDENYVTSVYDDASKQIFAIGEDQALYTIVYDGTSTYTTLYKTSQTFKGEQTKATMVENTPLIISLEENHVVLYFFNGVAFEKQDINLTTTSIQNITFHNKQIYIVDDQNKIQSANYTIPSKVNMDAQATKLQQDILTVYNSISGEIKRLTLEKKAEIDSLSMRYKALNATQQAQVLASNVLSELVEKTASLQKNVDDMNSEIAKLSTPELFKKEDVQKALAIQTNYNALKDFDKTLIDQKLLRILDKIKAFDVMDEIATLPSYGDIAISDLSFVQEISQHYDNLAQEWKKDVLNYATLQRLENRIYELMNENTLGDAYWYNFGGNKTSSATTNTKTPYTSEDVQDNFTAEGSYQESIIVDNHIYTIRDKNYLTILDNKGSVIAETKLYSKIGFFSRLAYGDGKIYVALSDRIQAFDAKTLRPLWLSQTGNQFISTITYHNGYIYSGMTTGGGGDRGKTNGYFFAINVSDEDRNNAYEVKDFAWTCGEEKNTGYYWAGAAIVGDAVVFAGDSGEVISHHLTQDIMFDRYLLGDTKVRANVSYIEAEKAILVGTQDSHTLFKIKMNENGSFKKDTIQSVNVEGEVTGGIAYYNGRAYVPSGGMYANGFSVVETKNMKIAYINKAVGSQSYPLISTAYANEKNNYEVKVYVLEYKTGNVLMMSDAQGQTTAKMDTLAEGYGTYNSSSITPDAYGNLYICGASSSGGGPLYSIQSKDAIFNIADMENAISNFPKDFTYNDKKEFQLLLNNYLSMNEGEQKQVKNADVLLAYEEKMQAFSDEKISRIQIIIDALPKQATLDNEQGVQLALKEYGELLESDQLRIQNYDALKLASEQLQALLNGFEKLKNDIEVIDLTKLTLDDQVSINTLLARYQKLSEQEKHYITNYDKLLQAQAILKNLADSIELPSLNEQVGVILEIGSLSLSDEKKIMSLYNSIMSLDENVRKQIVGYEKFLASYQKIIEQRNQVDEINNAIWNEIQPLNIQMRDRDVILDLYTRYAQLPNANKTYITNIEDLEYAKVVIDKMDKGYLAKELFEKIKMANTSYTFESTYDNFPLTYTFAGEDILQPDDFAFKMNSKSFDDGAIYSLDKNAKILSLAHSGTFPGKVKITMGTNLQDGVYKLYYYNPIHKHAELVQNIDIVDGMTYFTLTHASTYFISKENIDPLKQAQPNINNNVATGDNTSMVWLWMTIFTSLGLVMIVKKKRSI